MIECEREILYSRFFFFSSFFIEDDNSLPFCNTCYKERTEALQVSSSDSDFFFSRLPLLYRFIAKWLLFGLDCFIFFSFLFFSVFYTYQPIVDQ